MLCSLEPEAESRPITHFPLCLMAVKTPWEGSWEPEGEPPATDADTQAPPPGLISSPGVEKPGLAASSVCTELLAQSPGGREGAQPPMPAPFLGNLQAKGRL